ncbi:unnamed protein product [Prunus armeniaca]|uniref:C2H2-type domain-containing protein n=1 Tax=Prunus armeniaca TaxID=36596 RepID=A0A6J5UYI2_PRUAR|nr:unnamed protein product [Prunus armeniaca]
MELEDQQFKHLCKFCSKSFPCGRSLGGHMRSHLTNNSVETEEKLIIGKVKLPSANNVNSDFETGPHHQPGYGLRENPKKTWRLADSSEDTSLLPDKFCRECGKGFQSWKALFGHMKCHSEKERVVNSINSFDEEEEEDSWTCANQKLVMDNQSDNETTTPNRRRRSRRRRTRYMGTTTSSSNFSIANAATSSVSEIEQEQEEVALCLMMLKRDAGHWGGLKFVAHDSSDNNSVFSEAPSSGRTNQANADIKGKVSVCSGIEILKLKKKLNKKTLELGNLDSDFSKHGSRMKKEELLSAVGSEQSLKTLSTTRGDVLDSEAVCKSSQKRSKFECTTCNKVFRSYQALGGHRASHKKIKGCFASKVESSENTIETDLSPEPTSDSKLSKSCNNENPIKHDVKAEISTENKGHACPICLKVFPSGQALGGHKRSHLIGGSAENKNSQTIVIQKPAAPEVRDFLDLNLPAPVEEEISSSHAAAFKPWWVGSSHKHEALVGLISN